LVKQKKAAKNFVIGERVIGPDAPPLVIPEVGINHEGDFDKAIACVDAAVSAGAECIKFQCHITDAEMIPTDMKPGDISDEKLWDIIKRCELTNNEEAMIQQYCIEKGIIYLSTPFSKEAADRLYEMNVSAFKIGSGECNNHPLIEYIAQMGKPMIVSTGMNNIDSVKETVSIIENLNCPYMLMHCTSMYPTPYKHIRLGAIADLENSFRVPVGMSDHSLGTYTCIGAVALGACVLEKHFTVSRDWAGPDIPISIEPFELQELIKGANAVYAARGGTKTILNEERPVINFAYATIVTIAPIKKGEVFTEKNVWVKRPGTGEIFANEFRTVLGKVAKYDLKENVHLKRTDIA